MSSRTCSTFSCPMTQRSPRCGEGFDPSRRTPSTFATLACARRRGGCKPPFATRSEFEPSCGHDSAYRRKRCAARRGELRSRACWTIILGTHRGGSSRSKYCSTLKGVRLTRSRRRGTTNASHASPAAAAPTPASHAAGEAQQMPAMPRRRLRVKRPKPISDPIQCGTVLSLAERTGHARISADPFGRPQGRSLFVGDVAGD